MLLRLNTLFFLAMLYTVGLACYAADNVERLHCQAFAYMRQRRHHAPRYAAGTVPPASLLAAGAMRHVLAALAVSIGITSASVLCLALLYSGVLHHI